MPQSTFPKHQVEIFTTMRQRIHDFASRIPDEEFFAIPNGYNNSIAWNIGHIFVTHQLLCYQLSGLPMHIDAALCDALKKGSTPKEWATPITREALLSPLTSLATQFTEDAAAAIFENFTSYTTSAGVVLDDVQTAFSFNMLHEGLHLGYAMAQLRALRA